MVNLGEVAGNHSRFLFDFSPESIVLRLTDDPAPRILYGFEENDGGEIGASELVRKVQVGDINPSEIIVGGKIAEESEIKDVDGIRLFPGVKKAVEEFNSLLATKLEIES